MVAIAAVAWWNAGYFAHELIQQVAILAIFAMSLDLLVGFAGMVSLGHAAFFGLGAYATAALQVMFGWTVLEAMAGAIGVGAIGALLRSESARPASGRSRSRAGPSSTPYATSSMPSSATTGRSARVPARSVAVTPSFRARC